MALGEGNYHTMKATSSEQNTRFRPFSSLMTLGNGNKRLVIRNFTNKYHTETLSVKRVSNFDNLKSIDHGNIGPDEYHEYHSFNQHQADRNLLTKRGGGAGAHKVCRKKPTTILKCMDRIVYGRNVRFCVYTKAFLCTSVDRFRGFDMIVV